MRVGIHLHLHSDTICTACQYLHRFKANDENATNYDIGVVVCTALLIATKTNENHLRLSELISSVHWHIINEPDKTDYDQYKLLDRDVRYWKLRDSVTKFEQYMLRVLAFDLTIDLPHKYQIFYLRTLKDWFNDERAVEELFHLAWSVLNDYVCKRSLDERFKSTFMALISIDIALNIIEKSRNLIKRKQLEANWYTHFDKSLTTDIADEIKQSIFDVYNK